MSGPLAPVVDGRLAHDPQFNAKSQFTPAAPPTLGRCCVSDGRLIRRCCYRRNYMRMAVGKSAAFIGDGFSFGI
jgi:hypothetical protein